jgi:hypothetical protein
MQKDEFRSQEERTVAAVVYVPLVWLVFLLWRRWRLNYYTYYHMMHALLLSVLNFLLLVGTAGLTMLVSGWTGYNFFLIMVTGLLLAATLLASAVSMLVCALSAYNGRYSVLPLITPLFYLLFAARPHSGQEREKRPITEMRPYLRDKKTKVEP